MNEFFGCRPERAVQEIRGLLRNAKKRLLSRCPMLNNPSGDQMPHVVELMGMRIVQRFHISVRPTLVLHLIDLSIGRNRAIVPLGLSDDPNPFVQFAIQYLLAGDGIKVSKGFQPFVCNPVTPIHPAVFVLFQSGGNPEIIQIGRDLGFIMALRTLGTICLCVSLNFFAQNPSVHLTSSRATLRSRAWGLSDVFTLPPAMAVPVNINKRGMIDTYVDPVIRK